MGSDRQNRHLNLASRMLTEAKEYIAKADSVQASEKLYKASEEAIKVLAERFCPSKYEEAERKGRWTVTLLFSVARDLSKSFPEILDFWDHAWILHVEGFREARLEIGEVELRTRYIENLVELAGRNL